MTTLFWMFYDLFTAVYMFYLSHIGLHLSRTGHMDCDFECEHRDFICDDHFTTDDVTTLFEQENIECQPGEAGAKWSQSYHPLYTPGDEICAGYLDIPDVVACKPNISEVSVEMEESKRVCSCMNPGRV